MIMYDHSPNKHHQMIILSKWLHFILNAQLLKGTEKRGERQRTESNTTIQRSNGEAQTSILTLPLLSCVSIWFDYKDFKYYPLEPAIMYIVYIYTLCYLLQKTGNRPHHRPAQA